MATLYNQSEAYLLNAFLLPFPLDIIRMAHFFSQKMKDFGSCTAFWYRMGATLQQI